MTRTRRVLVLSSLFLAFTVALPTTVGAATHTHIRPRQYFAGLVNGSTGRPAPAIITMVCPGPGNGTGHPLGGQTVEVVRAVATNSSAGYTGIRGRSVSVFFGALPPTSGSAIGQVTLTHYGVAMPIPTSASLPCSGSGVVGFLPFPRTPPISRAATVPVEYVNIAATAPR